VNIYLSAGGTSTHLELAESFNSSDW